MRECGLSINISWKRKGERGRVSEQVELERERKRDCGKYEPVENTLKTVSFFFFNDVRLSSAKQTILAQKKHTYTLLAQQKH